jgi:GrpB-like predicted nucleotidyltransferase (UPF0157 family)
MAGVAGAANDLIRGGAVSIARQLADAGLGLDYEVLRLETTPESWVASGAMLAAHVAVILGAAAAAVEPIGSTSVVDLLAKPIVDLAVGLAPDQELEPVRTRLEDDGWVYRGDAGDDGGHVFVLEDRPWHRVAHAHVVPVDAQQWTNYLRLRELLRESPIARERYAEVKRSLLAVSGHDRSAYTTGKSAIVASLLGVR